MKQKNKIVKILPLRQNQKQPLKTKTMMKCISSFVSEKKKNLNDNVTDFYDLQNHTVFS